MSSPFDCKCPERKKPVAERKWVIEQYKCNHSAFNGYHRTSSDYSTVRCLCCGAVGRTKAKFVDSLRIAKPGEVEASSGSWGAQTARAPTPNEKQWSIR